MLDHDAEVPSSSSFFFFLCVCVWLKSLFARFSKKRKEKKKELLICSLAKEKETEDS